MNHLFFDTSNGTAGTINYYILVDTLRNDIEEYGISVKKGTEEIAFSALTLSQRKIENLLTRMVQGAVTPVTARDVVEDWLLA